MSITLRSTNLSTTKEVVLCDECGGTGEIDAKQQSSGHDFETTKVPCTVCDTTGRRIKLTTIQYLPLEKK